MTKYFFLFIFLPLLSCGTAQSPLFYAFGNVQSQTDNGIYKNITINQFNGGYRQYPDANYEPSDIPNSPTDFVIWGACTRFVVLEKISSVPLVVKVLDINGAIDNGDLTGTRVAIIQEARSGSINIGGVPNVADGNAGSFAGISPYEFACMQNYYKSQIADAISTVTYTAGSGIDITGQVISSTTVQKEDNFTSTSGQTVFTLSSSVSAPSGQTIPIRVYRNGTKLEYVSGVPSILQFTYVGNTVTTAANQLNDKITANYVIQ